MFRIIRTNLLLLFLFFTGIGYSQELSIEDLHLKAPSKLPCTSVKDQAMSSTCWSFSSVSLLESELLKEGKPVADLSEMFIARFSTLRKIKRHLQLKGGNFFTPGGQFHDVIWVVKNYGIVPDEIYSGRPYGQAHHDHANMDTILSHFVNDCVDGGITQLSDRQVLFVDSVLDYYLGPVPAEFVYKGTTYTPRTFADKYLGLHPDDYVEITSYTHHPFYSKFVFENKYNWTGDEYYNVTISDFSRVTDTALKKGYTVGWDGDADDPFFEYYDGIAYLPVTIGDFQKERQLALEEQSTLLNHMMHIVAAVKDRKGQKWYYVKNSWGASNRLGGFLFMRDDYFRIRTDAIIVNKNAIPADIRKKLGI